MGCNPNLKTGVRVFRGSSQPDFIPEAAIKLMGAFKNCATFTEEVPAIREKKGLDPIKSFETTAVPENNRNGLEKSPCKRVEQEENHEKGPGRSWARNHKGNSK